MRVLFIVVSALFVWRLLMIFIELAVGYVGSLELIIYLKVIYRTEPRFETFSCTELYFHTQFATTGHLPTYISVSYLLLCTFTDYTFCGTWIRPTLHVQIFTGIMFRDAGFTFTVALRMRLLLRPLDHISDVLRELHWLPIDHRIKFKLCVLMHSAHISRCPKYLT